MKEGVLTIHFSSGVAKGITMSECEYIRFHELYKSVYKAGKYNMICDFADSSKITTINLYKVEMIEWMAESG